MYDVMWMEKEPGDIRGIYGRTSKSNISSRAMSGVKIIEENGSVDLWKWMKQAVCTKTKLLGGPSSMPIPSEKRRDVGYVFK